jgi:hypothetical protein
MLVKTKPLTGDSVALRCPILAQVHPKLFYEETLVLCTLFFFFVLKAYAVHPVPLCEAPPQLALLYFQVKRTTVVLGTTRLSFPPQLCTRV